MNRVRPKHKAVQRCLHTARNTSFVAEWVLGRPHNDPNGTSREPELFPEGLYEESRVALGELLAVGKYGERGRLCKNLRNHVAHTTTHKLTSDIQAGPRTWKGE
jgi:hypothetical protein